MAITVLEALKAAKKKLAQVPDPRLDAEYLLAEQESWNDAYKELKQGYEYTLVLAQKYSR